MRYIRLFEKDEKTPTVDEKEKLRELLKTSFVEMYSPFNSFEERDRKKENYIALLEGIVTDMDISLNGKRLIFIAIPVEEGKLRIIYTKTNLDKEITDSSDLYMPAGLSKNQNLLLDPTKLSGKEYTKAEVICGSINIMGDIDKIKDVAGEKIKALISRTNEIESCKWFKNIDSLKEQFIELFNKDKDYAEREFDIMKRQYGYFEV